jgi:hypothetical protein
MHIASAESSWVGFIESRLSGVGRFCHAAHQGAKLSEHQRRSICTPLSEACQLWIRVQWAFASAKLLTISTFSVQPIKESSLGNIPTIAFADTDSPLKHVDIAIPANNKGKHSIGALYWVLTRMVLQMRGTITAAQPWDVMVRLPPVLVSPSRSALENMQ